MRLELQIDNRKLHLKEMTVNRSLVTFKGQIHSLQVNRQQVTLNEQ